MMRRLNPLKVILIVLFILLIPCFKLNAENRYIVKKGENLYEISKQFHVKIEDLKKVNQLKDDKILPGQNIIIPNYGNKEIVKRDSISSTNKVQKGKVNLEKKDGEKIESYTIRSGDNLFSISKKFGVSIEEIKRLNGLNSERLKVGQKLILSKKKNVDEEIEEIGDGDPIEPLQSEFDQIPQDNPPTIEKWKGEEERTLFIRVVKTFLGVPYKLGGMTLRGLDCSAFVKKIYEIFNVNLPRTAREQFRYLFSKKIEKKEELREGDLVFFKTRRNSNLHVGIYIGNNQFVHASSRNGEVKIDHLDTPYFQKRFISGVRVKELEVDS
jgi:LysM repeat protein